MYSAISCALKEHLRKKKIPNGINNNNHPFKGKISPKQHAAMKPYNKNNRILIKIFFNI
jgi:hypothetical protein